MESKRALESFAQMLSSLQLEAETMMDIEDIISAPLPSHLDVWSQGSTFRMEYDVLDRMYSYTQLHLLNAREGRQLYIKVWGDNRVIYLYTENGSSREISSDTFARILPTL